MELTKIGQDLSNLQVLSIVTVTQVWPFIGHLDYLVTELFGA